MPDNIRWNARFIILAIIHILSSSTLIGSATDPISKEYPNIVILFADDMGYGEVQALNPDHGKIPTPHINSLCKQGLVFTDAHTASSICTPSRYALLTGRYAWRTKLQMGVSNGGADPLIAADRSTIATILKQKGYNTAISGKWHLDFNYKGERCKVGTRIPDGPITRGFDTWFGFHHAREMRELCHDDEIIEVIKPHDMLPRTTDYAVNYIHQKAKESKEGKPFFLYMAFGSPHVPHLPTKEWIGKSGLGKYGDFVMMTDGMVGRIVDALHQHDIADDTIIIFSADNGTSKAANFEKLKEHGHHPSAHFRGCKTDYWEGAHRVPFVVRWPNGGIEGGEVCHDLIGLTDLYATIADLIGYTLPDYEAEDSLSFLASISNTKKNHLRENIIHHSGGGHFSIRKGKWKLLLSPGSGGLSMPNDKSAHRQGLAHIQLYNLEQDIRETTNLQAQYPEIVASLIELLKKQIRDGRSTTGSKQDNDFKNINIWKKSYIK